MDESIDIKEWFGLTLDELKFQMKYGGYERLSDCPIYDECETYRKAINYLVEAIYMPEHTEQYKIDTLENLIKE